MLKDDITHIEECQRALREHLQRLDVPIMRLDGDEDQQVLSGNEAAFIRLAIDCMETAARGGSVSFDPPLTLDGTPARLCGMKYDPDPVLQVITEQPWWGKILVIVIVGVIAVTIATGAVVDIGWLAHQVGAAFRR